MHKRKNTGQRAESGYTLLEILIVLAILALIATFAVPNLMKLFEGAKGDVATIQINNLRASLDIYRLENGAYPTEDQGIQALVERPDSAPTNWNGPYIDKPEALNDPWGNPYQYNVSSTGRGFELFSFGADNAEGGEGENADIGK